MEEDMDVSDGVRGSSKTGDYTPMDYQEPSTSRETSSFLGQITTRNEGPRSLKRLANTSDDDPNTPVKKPRSTESNRELTDRKTTYPTAGLTRSFHGIVYQLKHLGFTLRRAMELNKELPFYLSSERIDVGQFDDIVLEHSIDGGEKTALFIQLKHSRDKTRKVKAVDLLEKEGDDFFIPKYFKSWREMNKSEQFKVRKKLILGSNFGLDSKDLKKAEVSYERIDMSDKCFEMIATNDKTECYKFIPCRGRNRRLYDELKRMSDVHILARKLAKHVHGRKKLEVKGIFKQYHVALGKRVIDVENKKFRSDFIKGPKEPLEVSNFHRIFCYEFSKLKPSKSWKSKDISIEVSKTFGKPFEPLANPQLTDIDQLTREFSKLLKSAKNDELVVIPRDVYNKKAIEGSVQKIVADNIDKLAGHVLITEDGKIKFSTRFINDKIKSPGNIEEFKEQLKSLMPTLKEFGQYEFEIKNFNTCAGSQLDSNFKLPDDEITDDTVADFFEIFNLVVNLPNEVELGEIIEAEFCAQFNLLNADLIGSTFLMKMIEWFKGNGEKVGEGTYLSYAGRKDFIGDIENQIGNLMSMGVSSVYSEELKEYRIDFEEDMRSKRLSNFLYGNDSNSSTHRVLILKAPTATLLSTLRVYRAVMQHEGEQLKKDSSIFIRLGTLLLPEIESQVLRAFQSTECHNLLVIECDPASMKQSAGKLWPSLDSVIRDSKNEEKKIVLITRGDNSLSKQFKGVHTRSEDDDEISFINFTPDSRRYLLEKQIISLQGKEKRISLGKLLGIEDTRNIGVEKLQSLGKLIDSTNLVDLIRSDDATTLMVGNDLEELGGIKDYYINRSFFRHVVIPTEILEDKGRADWLIFSGISGNDLPKDLEKYTILDGGNEEEKFAKLCEENKGRGNIHWLKAESDKYIWKKSAGNISYLLKYRDAIDSDDCNRTTCALRSEDEFATHDGPVIISDVAGIGKSTLMTYLAGKLKRDEPHTLVLKIDLLSNVTVLKEVKEQKPEVELRKCEQAIDFLVNKLLKKEDDFSKRIFKSIIEEKRGVAMIFDGFDEISLSYEKIVIDLLHGLAEHGVKKLFVATRPHTRKILEKELNTFSHRLQQFSTTDQKVFFIKFWKKGLNLVDCDQKTESRLSTYAEAILKKLAETSNDLLHNFTGIPLQTRLVADIFQNANESNDFDSCEEFIKSTEDQPKLPDKLKLIDLYEQFINKKFDAFSEKFQFNRADPKVELSHKRDKNDFMVRHTKFALDTLFDQSNYGKLLLDRRLRLKYDITVENGYNLDEPGGIITEFIDKVPHFGHRTFAEYFAAKYLSERLKEGRFNKAVRRIYVADIFLKEDYSNLRIFMNSLFLNEQRNLLESKSWKLYLKNLRNNADQTVFHRAAAEGNAHFIRLFLNCFSGQPKDLKTLVNHTDNSGCRAVYLAAKYGHVDELKLLVNDGNVEVDYHVNFEEETLLHVAAKASNFIVVKCLLELGADPNSLTKYRITPLHRAAAFSTREVVTYLCASGANVHLVDTRGYTPLHIAAAYGRIKIVEYLVEKGTNVNFPDATGNTPLHEAAASNELAVVKYLVEHGANVDSLDAGGHTPLYHAAGRGRIEVLKYLVEKGATVNLLNAGRSAPLHEAALKGEIGALKYLIEKRAMVDCRNERGMTPLHEAATSRRWDVVKYLHEHGATVHSPDAGGNTPLRRAAAFDGIEEVKYLVEKGAMINFSDARGSTPLHEAVTSGRIEVVKYLVKEGANVHSSDTGGNTPLHEAAALGKIEVVKYLNEEGATLNGQNKYGMTPLHKAVASDRWDVVKYLLEHGATAHSSDAGGNTPLHKVAVVSRIELVMYLVERGAKVNFPNAKGETPLHRVAACGGIKVMKYLVEKGANVHSVTSAGNTPLHYAASSIGIEIVKYLVEKGAKINFPNTRGDTPLYRAAAFGGMGVVKYLVEKGADVNFPDTVGNTPLHKAIRCWTGIKVVKYLIKKGATVDCQNKDGKTPLHEAAACGKWDVVKYLLEQGAAAHSPDAAGNTPLHRVAAFGEIEVMKCLLEQGATVYSSNAEGNTLLHEAAASGRMEVVKYLVEKGATLECQNNDGMTPLYKAAASCRWDVVKYLLDHGATIDSSDAEGNTLLHEAVATDKIELIKYFVEKGAPLDRQNNDRMTPLYKAATSRRWDIVKYLIKHGASVHSSDAKGNTLLHCAATSGSIEVVKYSVEKGANVNFSNAGGNIPLHCAATSGNIKVVKYLAEKGANVYSCNAGGNTPLHCAAASGKIEVVKYLVEKGATLDFQNKDGMTPLHEAVASRRWDVLKYLLEHGASVNTSDTGGNTPLHRVAAFGVIEVMKHLVEKGAIVNSSNSGGNTPLHYAAISIGIEVVKYLVEKGANVNSTDARGNTPLHNATVRGKIEVVKYLVDKGANVNSLDASGNTPLHKATVQGEIEVVKYLIHKGANVNILDARGNTPLHRVAVAGKIEVFKYLVEKGATLDCQNEDGMTPLQKAAAFHNWELVKYSLKHGITVHSSDAAGNTPLHEAVTSGGIELVKYLVEKGANVNFSDSRGNTSLHKAIRCWTGIEVVKYLIEKGAIVDCQNKDGMTPLHVAIVSGRWDLVKYLLEHGATAHSFDAEGNTPLHRAAVECNIELVKHLVEKGARVNFPNAGGDTPLHRVAAFGGIEVVKYLVGEGAYVYSVNADGNTPLHYAASLIGKEVVKYLVEKGAEINLPNAGGVTPLHRAAAFGGIDVVKYLVEKGANVNFPDSGGNTPLHKAIRCWTGINVVKYLIGKGATVDCRNEHGKTPLDEAISVSKLDIVEYLREHKA